MLPGAVLTTLLVAQTFSDNRAVIERRLLDSARVDAAALDREQEAIIRALEVLTTSPALAADNLQAFHAETVRVQAVQPGWFAILLLAPNGQQLVSSRFPWGAPLMTAAEPQSLREVVERRTPVVGAISPGPPDSPGRRFGVRVPIARDGQVKYVLTAVIEASLLEQLVHTRLPATEEWTRTILDSKGTVAARSREAARFVGQPATPSFRARAASRATEVFSEQSIDGEQVYAALGYGKFGWTTAVVLPRSVVDAPVRDSTIALLTGGTLLMIGTLAALLLVSRRLTKDLEDVANAAEAVAEGRSIEPTPTHVGETKRLQESLRAAASLLERRQQERDEEVERAQAARMEAERANNTKDQFLAVLGHELRNPLAPALTALELMKLRDPQAFARERQVLERQVGHMARLVNDLLDVASLSRGKVALHRTRCEVRHIVDRALDMARPLIDRQAHSLAVNVPGDGLPVDGDEDRLVQVLTNLLTNAAKYTARGGRITVTAHRAGNTAVIACEDNGPGIRADLRSTLFTAFAQGPRSLDRAPGGLGLGLALARSFTTLHGGSIAIEDAPGGQGSRFVVQLPLAEGVAPSAPAAMPFVDRSGDEGRRVLVVDDNVDACEMLRTALEGAGHETAVALDGPRAIAVAASFRPEVGILDIGLPGMSGYELARELRRAHPEIRLIALTGYGQPADVQAAMQAGFDSHWTKPVEVAMLLAEMADVRV